jgi:hypothetical protein
VRTVHATLIVSPSHAFRFSNAVRPLTLSLSHKVRGDPRPQGERKYKQVKTALGFAHIYQQRRHGWIVVRTADPEG